MDTSYSLKVAARGAYIMRREEKNAEEAICRLIAANVLVEINNLFLEVGLSALSSEEEEIVLKAGKKYGDGFTFGPCLILRPLDESHQLQFKFDELLNNIYLTVTYVLTPSNNYKSGFSMKVGNNPAKLKEYLVNVISYGYEESQDD